MDNYVYVYGCTCTCTYAYVYTYIYVLYVYVYMYIYIYMVYGIRTHFDLKIYTCRRTYMYMSLDVSVRMCYRFVCRRLGDMGPCIAWSHSCGLKFLEWQSLDKHSGDG